MSEKILIKKILNELPLDVIYNIYLYCPRKLVVVNELLSIKVFFYILILLLWLSFLYSIGLLITNNSSIEFIFFNLFIGLLISSLFFLLCLFLVEINN